MLRSQTPRGEAQVEVRRQASAAEDSATVRRVRQVPQGNTEETQAFVAGALLLSGRTSAMRRGGRDLLSVSPRVDGLRGDRDLGRLPQSLQDDAVAFCQANEIRALRLVGVGVKIEAQADIAKAHRRLF